MDIKFHLNLKLLCSIFLAIKLLLLLVFIPPVFAIAIDNIDYLYMIRGSQSLNLIVVLLISIWGIVSTALCINYIKK